MKEFDSVEGQPEVPRDDIALEELKMCVGTLQFLMIRYMQMLALYIAFMGLLFREMLTAESEMVAIVCVFAGTFGNLVTFYAARCFKKMTLYSQDRVSLLADQLGMQQPYSVVWGYYVGILNFAITQLVLTGVALGTWIS